jgi:hypothetical protein
MLRILKKLTLTCLALVVLSGLGFSTARASKPEKPQSNSDSSYVVKKKRHADTKKRKEKKLKEKKSKTKNSKVKKANNASVAQTKAKPKGKTKSTKTATDLGPQQGGQSKAYLLVPFSLFATCIALLSLRRRHDRAEWLAAEESDVDNEHETVHSVLPLPLGFEPKAVFLDKETQPDPATKKAVDTAKIDPDDPDVSDTFPLAQPEIPLEYAITDKLPIPISEAASQEVTTTAQITSSPVKATPRAVAVLILPAAFAEHFSGFPNERLLRHVAFNVPLHSEGDLIVTSRRILVLYRQHTYKVFPPQKMIVLKKHQMTFQQIMDQKRTKVPRPIFLVAGAFLCWGFPFGSILSLACIAAFFVWQRPEMKLVLATGQKRTYPLSRNDLTITIDLIEEVKARKARMKKSKAAAVPKAS